MPRTRNGHLPFRALESRTLLRPPHKVCRFMPSVRIRENEYFDVALRRFKRACEKAGILAELRRREFYEKPTQERKRKKAAAVKRHAKRSGPRIGEARPARAF